MKRGNKVQRAAIAAAVAVALAAGAHQASAGVHRFGADTPSYLLPLGRAKMVDDGSGGIMARVRTWLASAHIFPDGDAWAFRLPSLIARRDN